MSKVGKKESFERNDDDDDHHDDAFFQYQTLSFNESFFGK